MDPECMRPMIFVDSKQIGETINASLMLAGYSLGLLSGVIALLTGGVVRRWRQA